MNKETQDGTWLNAGLIVSEGATLNINSSDVSRLKIEAPGINDPEDGKNANGLVVFGSLKIDSKDYILESIHEKLRQKSRKSRS